MLTRLTIAFGLLLVAFPRVSEASDCWIVTDGRFQGSSHASGPANVCYSQEQDIIKYAVEEICQKRADLSYQEALVDVRSGDVPLSRLAEFDEIFPVSITVARYTNCECTQDTTDSTALPFLFTSCTTDGDYFGYDIATRMTGTDSGYVCEILRNPHRRKRPNLGTTYRQNIQTVRTPSENIPVNPQLCPDMETPPSSLVSSCSDLKTQAVCEEDVWEITKRPPSHTIRDVDLQQAYQSVLQKAGEPLKVVSRCAWDPKANTCSSHAVTEAGHDTGKFEHYDVLGLGQTPDNLRCKDVRPPKEICDRCLNWPPGATCTTDPRCFLDCYDGFSGKSYHDDHRLICDTHDCRYQTIESIRNNDVRVIRPECTSQQCQCLSETGTPCREEDFICSAIDAESNVKPLSASDGSMSTSSPSTAHDDNAPPRIPFPYWLVNQIWSDQTQSVFTRTGNLLQWGFVSVDDVLAKIPDRTFLNADDLEDFFEDSPMGLNTNRSLACGLRETFWMPSRAMPVLVPFRLVGEDGDDREVKRAVTEFYVVLNRLRQATLARYEGLAIRDLLVGRNILSPDDSQNRERLGPAQYSFIDDVTGEPVDVDDPQVGDDIFIDPRFEPKSRAWVEALRSKLEPMRNSLESVELLNELVRQTWDAIWTIRELNQRIVDLSQRRFIGHPIVDGGILGGSVSVASPHWFEGTLFPAEASLAHHGVGFSGALEAEAFWKQFSPSIHERYSNIRQRISAVVAVNPTLKNKTIIGNPQWFSPACHNEKQPQVCMPSHGEVREALVDALEQERIQLLEDLHWLRKATAFAASGREQLKWHHPDKPVIERVTITHKKFYDIIQQRTTPVPLLPRLLHEPNATDSEPTLAEQSMRANYYIDETRTVLDFRTGVLDAATDTWKNFAVGAGLTVVSMGLGTAAGSARAAFGMLRTGGLSVKATAMAGLGAMGTGLYLDGRDVFDACSDFVEWERPLPTTPRALDNKGRLNFLSGLDEPDLSNLLGQDGTGRLNLGATVVEDYRGCVMTLALSLGINGLALAAKPVASVIRKFMDRRIRNHPTNAAALDGINRADVFPAIRRTLDGLPDPSFNDVISTLDRMKIRYEQFVRSGGKSMLRLISADGDVGEFIRRVRTTRDGTIPGEVLVDPAAKFSRVPRDRPNIVILSPRSFTRLAGGDVVVLDLLHETGHMVYVLGNKEILPGHFWMKFGDETAFPTGYEHGASVSEMLMAGIDQAYWLGQSKQSWQHLRNQVTQAGTNRKNRIRQDRKTLNQLRNILEEMHTLEESRQQFIHSFGKGPIFTSDMLAAWRQSTERIRQQGFSVVQKKQLSFEIESDIDHTYRVTLEPYWVLDRRQVRVKFVVDAPSITDWAPHSSLTDFWEQQMEALEAADWFGVGQTSDEALSRFLAQFDASEQREALGSIPKRFEPMTIEVSVNDDSFVKTVDEVLNKNQVVTPVISSDNAEAIRSYLDGEVGSLSVALSFGTTFQRSIDIGPTVRRMLNNIPKKLPKRPLSYDERKALLKQMQALAREIRDISRSLPKHLKDYVDEVLWTHPDKQGFFDQILQLPLDLE